MRLGTSIFLIALGAALKFAVDLPNDNLDFGAIGVILMLVGVVGLYLWRSGWDGWDRFADWRSAAPRNPARVPEERPAYREPRVVVQPAVEAPPPQREPGLTKPLVIYDDVRRRRVVREDIRPDDF